MEAPSVCPYSVSSFLDSSISELNYKDVDNHNGVSPLMSCTKCLKKGQKNKGNQCNTINEIKPDQASISIHFQVQIKHSWQPALTTVCNRAVCPCTNDTHCPTELAPDFTLHICIRHFLIPQAFHKVEYVHTQKKRTNSIRTIFKFCQLLMLLAVPALPRKNHRPESWRRGIRSWPWEGRRKRTGAGSICAARWRRLLLPASW